MIRNYFYRTICQRVEKKKDKEIKHFKVDKHPKYGTYCTMIVTQNGNEVPCNKKNLAGDKQKQENFINSEKNKIKFDDPKFKKITSREKFLKDLIESGRNLSADDDFYVRFMYATCLRHHEPIYNHDIQHFKTIKNECIVLVKNDDSEIQIRRDDLAGKLDRNHYMRRLIEDQINEFKINGGKRDGCEVNHTIQFQKMYQDFLKKKNIPFEKSVKKFVLSEDQKREWKDYQIKNN